MFLTNNFKTIFNLTFYCSGKYCSRVTLVGNNCGMQLFITTLPEDVYISTYKPYGTLNKRMNMRSKKHGGFYYFFN